MTKYFCDVCKKEVKPEMGFIPGNILFSGCKYTFDVCYDCHKKIENHFEDIINGISETLKNINENN